MNSVMKYLTFGFAVIFILVILWIIPELQITPWATTLDPKDYVQAKNNARATLAQIIGGLILLVGAYITWRNMKLMEASLKQTQDATQENLKLSREGQITERFSKAISQLGDEKLEIRLGGIYSLAHIARDSERDYLPIMQILSAFIRVHSSYLVDQTKNYETRPPFPEPDIQAALAVMGQFYVWQSKVIEQYLSHGKDIFIDLRKIDTRGLDLSHACFEFIDFRESHFEGANLEGANLRGADLRGGVFSSYKFGRSLTPAEVLKLQEDPIKYAAYLDCSYTKIDSVQTNLMDTDLTHADLANANFEGVDLSQTIGLTEEQIRKAKTDEHTKMPGNLRRND
jgi:uncharacterized protein YjbI with pentapeptide repeats